MSDNKNIGYSSELLQKLLDEISPNEQKQTDNKMILAARIAALIKKKGLKKKDFASMLNKQSSEISKWLSGTHNFTVDTLTEISMVLGVELTELFVSVSEKPTASFSLTLGVNSIGFTIDPLQKNDTPKKTILDPEQSWPDFFSQIFEPSENKFPSTNSMFYKA